MGQEWLIANLDRRERYCWGKFIESFVSESHMIAEALRSLPPLTKIQRPVAVTARCDVVA
jgi:hypothetical protein